MPIDIEDNLVNAAIVEFHAARDHGQDDAHAWAAAVARVRHDVMRLAIAICQQQAIIDEGADPARAAGCEDCVAALRQRL